jgi:hypothetical protein
MNIIESRIGDVIFDNNNMANINLSGKVASSHVDLTDGSVKAVIFGDWSLNAQSINTADFYADFTIQNASTNSLDENMGRVQREEETNQTNAMIIHFKVRDLRLNSFQKINEDLSVKGTTNIMATKSSLSPAGSNNNPLASEHLPRYWNDVKTTITVIEKRVIIITFDKSEQQMNKIFGNLPIIGIVIL